MMVLKKWCIKKYKNKWWSQNSAAGCGGRCGLETLIKLALPRNSSQKVFKDQNWTKKEKEDQKLVSRSLSKGNPPTIFTENQAKGIIWVFPREVEETRQTLGTVQCWRCTGGHEGLDMEITWRIRQANPRWRAGTGGWTGDKDTNRQSEESSTGTRVSGAITSNGTSVSDGRGGCFCGQVVEMITQSELQVWTTQLGGPTAYPSSKHYAFRPSVPTFRSEFWETAQKSPIWTVPQEPVCSPTENFDHRKRSRCTSNMPAQPGSVTWYQL